MKYTNATSFKAKIRNIAKKKRIPAQQVQQNYLIEQVLRLIVKSEYKKSFVVKGGYLISNIIGIDKRTTMDLDVMLKGAELSKENLLSIFNNIFRQECDEGFTFMVDSLAPIRSDDEYGGFVIKINASFDTLREVVFIDVTTGDKITPYEIQYAVQSIFLEDEIEILSYNLETVLAEKLECVLSRGEGSTRPRDRYDLFTVWKMYGNDVSIAILREALKNTATKRESLQELNGWSNQVSLIRQSDYQKQMWMKYQRTFKYANEISFEESVEIVQTIMSEIE
ncbi:abortive phage infection protein [Enterococcus sp. JM4C]|uniref:nucleotidyl transferase AbiEii/AbiGii toxin family protein n=1 Tax=Candidatus Enterococcus huntleyi TaxID=1857217 RepID=UPI00137A74F6|nr:nucleotidyl transferase AbiEii/AbiGii toxin family protein [Enterococcus sp. JM4C]KAF1295551.1 abortive phage infection protein [Enterococcus sp. JM4C]